VKFAADRLTNRALQQLAYTFMSKIGHGISLKDSLV